MSGEPIYTEQEAEEILRLASQKSGEGISRERLIRMAEELGISPEAVTSAAETVRAQSIEITDRQEFERSQRRSFINHLMSYLFVNMGLIAFNLIDEHRITWAIWPIIGWGIGVATQAANVFLRGGEKYDLEFQKWRSARALGAELQHRAGSSVPMVGTSNSILQQVENIALRQNLYKLEAIKQVRDETGLGLREAKDAVDEFDRRNPGIFRDR